MPIIAKRSRRERLVARIDPASEPGGCWLWTGHRLPRGYGKFSPLEYAHRVSWELANGPVPPGMHVLHRCDTPPCVNPAHLFLGTHADNMADMTNKGRRASRLTPPQVAEMRSRWAAGGTTHKALAAEYGVSRVQVTRIVNGRRWREDNP